MSSDNIQVEPHVLKFMSQIDEPSDALARRPVIVESPDSPKLRWVTRKLSEPAHKFSKPLKPILKSKRAVTDTKTPTDQTSSRSAVKRNVPLRFASRKMPPPIGPAIAKDQDLTESTVNSESDDELFYTPGSIREDSQHGPVSGTSLGEKGYLGAREDMRSSNYYADPPTPLPTPPLRVSFSQNVPYQGYPLTPHNTVRHKRRTPPIVDELDRQRNSLPFPSRQSFTFTPPVETPLPSDFPLPPAAESSNNAEVVPSSPTTSQDVPATVPPRRFSWHPSLPAFTRRAQDKITPQRPEPERTISKRKSTDDAEATTKRRKVVQFALPPEDQEHRQEHPPMRRRPTPYYEPVSTKMKRILHKLVAPFRKSAEERGEAKAAKVMAKAAKKARKEREELVESYRHFDDTVD